jgi:hypothetical protein
MACWVYFVTLSLSKGLQMDLFYESFNSVILSLSKGTKSVPVSFLGTDVNAAGIPDATPELLYLKRTRSIFSGIRVHG